MSASSRRSANRRRGGVQRSLTDEQIVEAALALTLEAGLDTLTMAALARRLDVGVMTLYSYFRSRSELLSAMAQSAVVALYERHVDVEDGSWDDQLRAHYHSLRKSLKEHPSLADLLFYQGQFWQLLPGNSEVRDKIAEHVGRHVEVMIRDGIEPRLAVRAFYGLSMFTLTSALREEDLKPPEHGQDAVAMRQFTAQLVQWEPDDIRFGSDEQFDVMLDLMLAGLKATIH